LGDQQLTGVKRKHSAVQRMARCGSKGLRYMLLPLERVIINREITVIPNDNEVSTGVNACMISLGTKELACGSQAPIATLLFDPSMSALPIIVKHNSQRVGLFTR